MRLRRSGRGGVVALLFAVLLLCALPPADAAPPEVRGGAAAGRDRPGHRRLRGARACTRPPTTTPPRWCCSMDTPGGLDTAMRSIIQAMLASPVPVLAYVAPGGARAASAGTYILYASALARHGAGHQPRRRHAGIAARRDAAAGHDRQTPGDAAPAAGPDAETAKITNDAAAYIRGLATLHGRNADWAEQAVREAVSLLLRRARCAST